MLVVHIQPNQSDTNTFHEEVPVPKDNELYAVVNTFITKHLTILFVTLRVFQY